MIDRVSVGNTHETADGISRRNGFRSMARRFVAFTLVGMALGLMAMLVLMRHMNYDPTPSLSPKQFYAAREHWKNHRVSDYELEVQVTGPQAATYRVEVRQGEAISAWRNNQPLQSQRTFGTWSIPGMFSTISRDIEAVERAEKTGKQLPLILRAEFNPQFGFPEHYRRIDNGSRKGGDSIAVTWDVLQFRVLDALPGSAQAGAH